MAKRYLSILLLLLGLQAAAQTIFIPDVFVRGRLNAAKPNSVDVNGNCDTAVWNAQPPAQVTVPTGGLANGSTVDLEGIQHLKIPDLGFSSGIGDTVYFLWPGYPQNIVKLELQETDVDNFTGALLPFPTNLDFLWCDSCGLTYVPAFSGTRMWFFNTDLGGQVLTIPSSVTELFMDNCNLTQIPFMPNVTVLRVSDNPLSSWSNLPSGLTSLGANNVGLNYLPTLPAGLVGLGAAGNGFTSVPTLPSSMRSLALSDNLLTSLPALPIFFQALTINNNPLTALPSLPYFFQNLMASNCNISTLDPWPTSGSLTHITLDGNPISNMPAFPFLQEFLSVQNCTALTCLPVMPQTLDIVRLSGSGITCLPNITPNLSMGQLGIAPVVCDIGNSPCPLADPLITGTTFHDADLDGVLDVGEAVRPNSIVQAQPGDLLVGSDVNGNYILPAGIGSYSVTGVPGLYEPVTTTPYAVTFTGVGQVDSLNHIGFDEIPGMYDLVTEVVGTNVRPGFNTGVWVQVNNVGTEPTTAAVQLTFDAALSYVSSTIAPAINGNVLDWTTPVLVPGGSWNVWVQLYGPPSLVLGSPVVQQATSAPSQPDQTPADNTYVLNDVVVGSFDPNDKRVEPDYLTMADVAGGTRVNYTVRFQNTGTFPAERVLITDTLSSDLQWATMNFTASSHACSWYIHNGVLHVLFENINLPDSVSDEPGSHGFVKFSFVPSSSLVVGSAVGNIANIYFDYNEPVITNDAIFYVETGLAVDDADADGLRAWPNPTDDLLIVQSERPMSGSILVLDATGRIVLTQPANGTRSHLSTATLAPGAYLLQCTTVERTATHHFIKH